MSIPRYHTVGAVAADERALAVLSDRLEELEGASVLVLVRGRDEKTARAISPEGAAVRRIEFGLRRAQWIELASAYLGVTAVSVLMGAVHLPTGIVVQAVVTLAILLGLLHYGRKPRLEGQLLRMGLPDRFASEWAAALPSGFACVLATVPADDADEAEWAFLETGSLKAPLAVDRRPVL
jgi:hypothetical protein